MCTVTVTAVPLLQKHAVFRLVETNVTCTCRSQLVLTASVLAVRNENSSDT